MLTELHSTKYEGDKSTMKISYNVTGMARKSLVAAISQELNTPNKYLGMPTAAYEIGCYNIDKDGTITGEDNRKLITILREAHGFVPVSEDYDTTDAEPLVEMTEPDNLVIVIPLDGFTTDKLDNLTKLVKAKETLIKAALGTDTLPIEVYEDKISFPWFDRALDRDRLYAYTTFISLLCKTAKEKQRITATAKVIENPKYAFRCFLLSLGMIGAEYKACRHILLKKLEGNGAYAKPESANTEAVDE